MKLATKNKLPFEVKPQLKRFLDDITFTYKEWRAKDQELEQTKDLDFLYLFEPYTHSEVHTLATSHNNQNFWAHLERNLKAIKIVSWRATADELRTATENKVRFFIARTHKNGEQPFKMFSEKIEKAELELAKVLKSKNPSMPIPKPKRYIAIKILNIEPIETLRNEIEMSLQTQAGKEKGIGGVHRLIYRDGDGNFFIGKFRDQVPFKSKKADYYKVFSALYKCAGGGSAWVTYKQISEHIRLHEKGKELSVKDIQNHINNSIRRRYLKEKTPDDKMIISTDNEGKKIYFYNPPIEE